MKHILILTALLVAMVAKAQLPADFRSEQIYLNPEKTTVLPGDTLGLEGMVTCLAPDRMLPYSNYVYVECYDERDSVLVRQKLRCKDQGYFNTRIATDYLWPAGVYYLRAYTQLMRNFSQESFAVQPFLLAKEFPDKEKQVYEARCTFVPSGGKLVAGQMQTVAALLTDENRPIFVALDGDAVAGYCFCQICPCPAATCSVAHTELYIDDLCVDENCRGQGIATALYRHVTDYARQAGIRDITLNVWCGNDSALRFYEKMGMTPRKIMMEQTL